MTQDCVINEKSHEPIAMELMKHTTVIEKDDHSKECDSGNNTVGKVDVPESEVLH